MPGKCCAILFLLVFNTNSFAQNTTIDSLRQVWNDETQADTIRLKAIHKIAADGYLYSQPDSAFYYAQLQYEFAKEIGIKKQMAVALNTQGTSYYFRNNYPNAIDYHTRSLKISEETGDKNSIAGSLNNIGNIYIAQRDYTKATDYYTRSLDIMEEIGNRKGIAFTLNNIGLIYSAQDDYAAAITHYTRSLEIMEEIGNKMGIASSLNNIGLIYSAQDDYAPAITYYTRSLKIMEEIGSKRGIASSLNNIGGIHNKKGDYHKAINYSTQAITNAQEGGTMIEIRDAANNLYKAYKHIGNLKASLEMHELYTTMRDSIENIETQRKVIRQEFKYNYEKQALADSLLFVQQRKLYSITYQTKLYSLISGFGLLLILLGVYLRIRFIKKRAEKEALLQEIKLLKVETMVKMVSSTTPTERLQLNKEKIEAAIDASLNPTDWNILNALYENPTISNRKIAEQVSLSMQGVYSSLVKMYRLFDLQKKAENQRIALVIKAVKISNDS